MVEKQTEQPTDQPKPKRNKKPFIIAGIVAFGVVFIVVAIVLCLCLKTPPKEEPAPSVDFSQQVTNVDGTEFKPTYDAGSDDDLSVRFTDLECNEACSNISNLKIGDKILKAGEDYEVKRGSVIIVIYKKILQAIKSGQYDITFEIKSGEKTISVGLKITIANSSAPADEEEEEKDEEKDEQENGGSQSQSNSSSQSPSEPEVADEPEEEKTCSELQNCDYNLNDQYVFATSTFSFFALSEGVTDVCAATGADPDMYDYIVANFPIVETRTFYYVGRFAEGTYGLFLEDCLPVQSSSLLDQAKQYASSKGLGWMWNDRGARLGYGCPGYKGCAYDWTWQKVIDDGFALDEEKCATYGLSCGRW